MFNVSFGEIFLLLVVGLLVLGPQRLPIAIKTVAGWIRVLRSLSATVQTELAKEFQLEEIKKSLQKVEQSGLQDVSPEIKASMDELRKAAESMQNLYRESGNQILASKLDKTELDQTELDQTGITDGSVSLIQEEDQNTATQHNALPKDKSAD